MSKYTINPEAPLYPLSIENGGTNATTSAAAITNLGAMPEHPTHIEFTAASNANNGGYIDFNYPGPEADYTSRIIEEESGVLAFKGDKVKIPEIETTTPVGINCGGTNATTLSGAKKNLGIGVKYLVTVPLAPVAIESRGWTSLNEIQLRDDSTQTLSARYGEAITKTAFVTIHNWQTTNTTGAFSVNKSNNDNKIYLMGTPGSTINNLSIELWRFNTITTAANVAEFIAD